MFANCWLWCKQSNSVCYCFWLLWAIFLLQQLLELEITFYLVYRFSLFFSKSKSFFVRFAFILLLCFLLFLGFSPQSFALSLVGFRVQYVTTLFTHFFLFSLDYFLSLYYFAEVSTFLFRTRYLYLFCLYRLFLWFPDICFVLSSNLIFRCHLTPIHLFINYMF